MKLPWSLRAIDVARLLTCVTKRVQPGWSRGNHTRLQLELLEDRTAPAILTVINAGDPVSLTAGTLRYEVNQANIDADAGHSDTIVFSGVTAVTLLQGQLQLTGQNSGNPATITIIGTIAGGGQLTINGDHANYCVFQVSSGAQVALDNLIITNGNANNFAGGISNNGTLAINNCTISANFGYLGGGIYNSGALNMSGDIVTANNAISNPGDNGAEIYNDSPGTFVIYNCTISLQESENPPGYGIYNRGSGSLSNSVLSQNYIDIYSDGTLAVTNCTLTTAGDYGIGIQNDGSLTLTDSSLAGNGGGIANGGTLMVTGSYLSGNVDAITNNDGALTINTSIFSGNLVGIINNNNSIPGTVTVCDCTFTDSYEGAIDNAQTTAFMTVVGCTFAGNENGNGGSSEGGAIYNDGTLTISNSTFSENTAAYAGQGNGGAIYNAGYLTMIESTVVGNSAASRGGGICNTKSALLISDIIVGNNAPYEPDFCGTTPEPAGAGLDAASSANLIGIANALAMYNGINGNQIGVTAAQVNLAPLGAYGGPTETMALLPGSIALGAGSAPTALVGALTSTATTFSVADASWLGLIPNVSVLSIDSEQVLFTSVNGDTLNVERGYNGTTAVAHDAWTPVYPAFDQRGLSRLRNGQLDVGAYESQGNTVTATTIGTSQTGPFSTTTDFTFTATIASIPVTTVSAGTVTFYAGPGLTNPIGSPVSVSGGSALSVATTLPAGSDTVTAVYSGATNYSGSQGTTTVTVSATATTTTLTDNGPNASTIGQSVNFIGTVSSGVPIGDTVLLEDASNSNAVVATTTTGSGGSFGFNVSNLLAGTHNLFAVFAGDATYATSQSSPVTQVVNLPPTPTVTSIVVNGDAGDNLAGTHSRVASLYVTFSEPVQLGSGAFTLALHNNVTINGTAGQEVGTLPPTLNWSSNDNIHWTVTFAGTSGVNVNVGADGHVTIMDGVYDLTVVANQVQPYGVPSVNMASNFTQTFWALFGDTGACDSITSGTIGDGNTRVAVGNGDFNDFANAYQATGYNVSHGYVPALDVDGDGSIGNVDFNAFANNYQTIWTF